jgi:hypothetical protein
MHSFLSKIFFTVFIFIAASADAQVKFTAELSAQQISKNEMVQLRLSVENAQSVEQITPAAFSNFSVISGPNQESGMSAVNGVVKQYVAISFILKPKAPGTFTIPAATAKADGKDYRSNAVSIKVTNTIAPNTSAANNSNPLTGFNPFEDMQQQTPFTDYILKKGESAADKISRNMFVKLQTNKTTCFVGEPVIATYKLYTRLKSESNLVKNPSFSGFSVIDMQQPDNINYTRETVNGREYNVYIIRKVQLYPLQIGALELDAVQLENSVQFIKEEYAKQQENIPGDILNEFAEAAIPPEGMETQKVTLQNTPVVINVKSLPAVNVPVSFKGATGQFTIKAAIQNNTFTTEDAGKLNIVIEGNGNLQLITPPDINWPVGIDGFEPVITDDVSKNTVPVSGRKMLAYNFTVTVPGSYSLPPVMFSYFNPATGKYKTDSAPSIVFTVIKGAGKKIKGAAVVKESSSPLNKFFNNRRWVISAVIILIVLGILIWLKSDKHKEEKKEAINNAKVTEEMAAAEITEPPVKNYLERAALLAETGGTVFYHELNFALKDFLADKLNMPAATLNKKIITEELDKKNVSVETVIQLHKLLNDIELELYTPVNEPGKASELYNNTAGMIQLLDTYKS